MIIDSLRNEDLDDFLALASEERWICDKWEFDFLLRHFPQGCLVERLDDRPVAFITAIKYATSGWIGNLVVHRDLRGKGIGNALMQSVLRTLQDAGAGTIWLTASEAGRPIYERLGFVAIDRVRRWFGRGSNGRVGEYGDYSMAHILAMDRAGWGDTRAAVLMEVMDLGMVTANDNGFLIGQPSAGGMQLGPWGATGRETALRLLDTARSRAGMETQLFLDVPARNVDAAWLLRSRGFSERGGAVLMYLGEKPAYDPSRIYALASMGSMG